MNIFRATWVVVLLLATLSALAQSSAATIVGQDLTGSWFNPDRDGEGCNVTEEGDRQTLILTCYTYLDGKQVWLIGSGILDTSAGALAIDQMVATHGAQFGSAFRAQDVVRRVWGRVAMTFADCNSAQISFEPIDPRYSDFATAYRKIVPGACASGRMANATADTTAIGNWFNPARDGEGVQVTLEGDGDTYVATYYTYLDGEQVWLIGTGHLQGTQIQFDDMILTGGADFGTAFDPGDVTRTRWGRMVVDIADCSSANVSFNSDLPQFESFSVGMVKIVEGPCHPITLRGRVVSDGREFSEHQVVNATVTASVGGRSYSSLADELGNYELRVVLPDADTYVRLSARGSGEQSFVRLESLLGNAGRLLAEAGDDAVLEPSEDAQVNVTHFSTAQYALLTEANGGQVPDSDDAIFRLSEHIEIAHLIDYASMIRMAIIHLYDLPDGVADTLALVSSPANVNAFRHSLPPLIAGPILATILDTLPSGTTYSAGTIPAEYALYLTSPTGALPTPDGGVLAFVTLDGVEGSSGTAQIWLTNLNMDVAATWQVDQHGSLTIAPDAPMIYGHVPFECQDENGGVSNTTFVDQLRLRRLARGERDLLQVELYAHAVRTDAAPGQGCEVQPGDENVSFGRTEGAFGDTTDALPFTHDEMQGRRMLPFVADPDAGGVSQNDSSSGGSAVLDLESGAVDAPGMASLVALDLEQGRITAEWDRGDASASYRYEYRRYRSDGRGGDAVLALVTRSDGARAIAAGMSVRVDPDLSFFEGSAPGIYRSGLQLGRFPSESETPFFVQLDAVPEHSGAQILLYRDLLDPDAIDASVTPVAWSIEDELLAVRRPGEPAPGSNAGFRLRDWLPIAVDGNRIYVRERLFDAVVDPAHPEAVHEQLFLQRSNFYDVVDAVQFDRP